MEEGWRGERKAGGEGGGQDEDEKGEIKGELKDENIEGGEGGRESE